MPPFVPPTRWTPDFAEHAPWGSPLRPAARRFGAYTDWPRVDDYNTALASLDLRAASGVPLRFVPQAPASRRKRKAFTGLDALYDGRIYARGEVATRERSWHDWLNALVWATFPRAKAALNARQYGAHRARLGDGFVTLPNARTREQDALAMLDEGGLLLLTSSQRAAETLQAVADGDTEAIGRLCRERAVTPLLFGHALYEHGVVGDFTARGAAVQLTVPDAMECPCDRADALLAARLADPRAFVTVQNTPGVPLEAWDWAREVSEGETGR